MLNLEEINNTIEELENGSTTFDTCSKLASLYIVRDKLATTNVEEELNDILPQYRIYCNIKRKYQMGEVTEQTLYNSLTAVCKEINEFLHILYVSTDTQYERDMIRDNIVLPKEAL